MTNICVCIMADILTDTGNSPKIFDVGCIVPIVSIDKKANYVTFERLA